MALALVVVVLLQQVETGRPQLPCYCQLVRRASQLALPNEHPALPEIQQNLRLTSPWRALTAVSRRNTMKEFDISVAIWRALLVKSFVQRVQLQHLPRFVASVDCL